MSLFPAYAKDLDENNVDFGAVGIAENNSVSLAVEAQLLASDNDEEQEVVSPPSKRARCDSGSQESDDFYLDRKFDCGNLRVSTLYYPGRPQYEAQKRGVVEARSYRGRYFDASSVPASLQSDDEAEVTARVRVYRQMLNDRPTDEALWLQFIDFQERYRDAETALVSAEEAAVSVAECRALRGALHRLRELVLPARRRLELLRAEIVAAPLSTELWLRLVRAAAHDAPAAEVLATATAALHATRAQPLAYPLILYEYGAYLRSAGLWERLVLLLELVMSMNFPPDVFPPPYDLDRFEAIERELQETEDKIVSSGLPLSTVWVRVERARAAARWRPPPPALHATCARADPQRVPLACDVGELLRPAQGPAASALLLVTSLRLAGVPLLPLAGYVLRAVDHTHAADGDPWSWSSSEALIALSRGARRLPAAHPARAAPGAVRALAALLVEPPHSYSEQGGYSAWLSALWDSACEWSRGDERVALLAWRLRWCHALALLLDTEVEPDAREARRIRSSARAALKRWGGGAPLLFAQFARLEAATSGAAPARRVALQALRAALPPRAVPRAVPHHALYCARVLHELGDEPAALWGTLCAATLQPLPDDDRLAAPPPPHLVDLALATCEETCEQLEAELSSETPSGADVEAGLVSALLPGRAEWAAARARLAPAPRRAQLLRAVRAAGEQAQGRGAARYWEQSACALATAAAREHRQVACARLLAPAHPHNALLALACSGGPVWSCGGERARPSVARSHVATLARALPALLAARGARWRPDSAARAAASCERAARGAAPPALLHAARLEAEARAHAPRTHAALLHALDAHPLHKWLYVRGAAWCGAQWAALSDVLLERELRLHALPTELHAPPDETHTAPVSDVS